MIRARLQSITPFSATLRVFWGEDMDGVLADVKRYIEDHGIIEAQVDTVPLEMPRPKTYISSRARRRR